RCRDGESKSGGQLEPTEHRRDGGHADERAPHVRQYHPRMKVSPLSTGSLPETDERWTAILRGDGFAAVSKRFGRRIFALFPGRPRCKICNAPYGGPVTLPFRLLGYRPSQRTPHVCARCLESAPEGGAFVP